MKTSDHKDDLIGQTLEERWEIVDLLGEGGMGIVYLGLQVNLGREVAVKVLKSERSPSEGARERFKTEAEIISQLEHPSTLKLIDFGELEDGRLFFVTERLRGTNLQQALDKTGRLGWRRTLRILRAVTGSLREAHELGVIHRDLKPSNIFLADAGGEQTVKVLDFGVAKIEGTPPDGSITQDGFAVGTPDYMSPEQAAAQVVDGRSDLFSLGVLAYRCLTGVMPDRPPLPFGSLTPPIEVPDRVEALVMGLLSPAVEDRPASALVLADTLDDILATQDLKTATSAVPAAEATQPAMAPIGRPRWPVFVAVAALLLGGLLLYLARPAQAPIPPVATPEVTISEVSVIPDDAPSLRTAVAALEPKIAACYVESGLSGPHRIRFLISPNETQITIRPSGSKLPLCLKPWAPHLKADNGLHILELTAEAR